MNARPRTLAPDVSEAARALGCLGGRPRGSCSSKLGAWLRAEVAQRRSEGYRCVEAFGIVRESEITAGPKSLRLTEATMDEWAIDPKIGDDGNDLPVIVSLSYWKKMWRSLDLSGFSSRRP
jgi:hypothetical protein